MLETPEQIRQLQRKLYQKAKQEKKFRFYLLYDKVFRLDILGHAYDLVRENKGAAGVDGLTFEIIEGTEGAQEYLENIARELKAKTYKPMPVRRVYIPKADGGKRPLGIPTIKDRIVQMATKIVIEPIFEADFQENSYGFRPKRSAHQAMGDITKHLWAGRTEVIDADISKYFDTIPHDKLLKEVAKRIVDKNILKLIKRWLAAPVVEEDEDGKKKFRPNDKGTPQGGVISPLLANIYLNILDTHWKEKRIQEKLNARLIRYCDDFVVLCRGNTEKIQQEIEKVLNQLGLSLNEQKTKTLDARKESFNFLGFTIKFTKSTRTGRVFPLVMASKKAVNEARAEIKYLTREACVIIPIKEVIKRLNMFARGWSNYFYFKNSSKQLWQVKWHLENRLRKHLMRRRRKPGWGFKRYPNEYLYELGLYKIPTTAPWKTANACG